MNITQVLGLGWTTLLPMLVACASGTELQPTTRGPSVEPKPSTATATVPARSAAMPGYEIVFEETYTTGMTQVPRMLIRTSDGGYAFAGSVALTEKAEQADELSRRFGFWLTKVDRAGALQWKRVFASKIVGGSRKENAFTVVEARDGALIVAGTTTSDDVTGKSMGIEGDPTSPPRITAALIVCYDKAGTERWRKTMGNFVGPSANGFFASAAVAGGYLLAGVTTVHVPAVDTPEKKSARRSKQVLWFVKIDDAGELLWERKFDDLEVEATFVSPKLILGADGSIVLAFASAASSPQSASRGDTKNPAGALQQVVVARFDENGRESKRTAFTMLTRTPLIAANADGYLVAGFLRHNWYALLDKDLTLRMKEVVPDQIRLNGLIPERDGFRGAGGSTAPLFVFVSSEGKWRTEPATPKRDLARIDDIVSGDKAGEFAYLWHDFERRETRLLKLRPTGK